VITAVIILTIACVVLLILLIVTARELVGLLGRYDTLARRDR
jgi:uncharacterized protein YoxC